MSEDYGFSFVEMFWDSMSGIALIFFIWLWLPGLGTWKLYRWLYK